MSSHPGDPALGKRFARLLEGQQGMGLEAAPPHPPLYLGHAPLLQLSSSRVLTRRTGAPPNSVG